MKLVLQLRHRALWTSDGKPTDAMVEYEKTWVQDIYQALDLVFGVGELPRAIIDVPERIGQLQRQMETGSAADRKGLKAEIKVLEAEAQLAVAKLEAVRVRLPFGPQFP